jgi:hypothetical protein
MIKPLAMFAALLTTFTTAYAADLGVVEERGGPGIKVGILTCGVEGGFGLIIVSHKGFDCEYTPARNGPRERYSGSITRIGVDLGFTNQSVVTWAVIAPGETGPGALDGVYVGAGAEATAVAGWGANVLVGGSSQTIALQPLSIQAQTGLDVAAGIAGLHLDYLGARP